MRTHETRRKYLASVRRPNVNIDCYELKLDSEGSLILSNLQYLYLVLSDILTTFFCASSR